MDICVAFLSFFMVIFSCYAQNNLSMGPYKANVLISEACKVTSKPFDKNPAIYFNSEIYTSGGKKLLKGNLTVVKVIKNMKIQARGYVQDDGEWNIMNIANSAGCHGMIMKVIKFAFNVQSHAQSCIPKGMYTYKDLDFDSVQQIWSKSFMYGKYLWRVEIFSNAGTLVCWEYVCDIKPK